MNVVSVAGWAGFGFVLVAVVGNGLYLRAGLPFPMSGKPRDEVVTALRAVGPGLARTSVLVPASWLLLTVFGAGLWVAVKDASALPADIDGWALAGFGGILLQNATFGVVEGLRFGLAAAAHQAGGTDGLWALSNVLFGFNQMFLSTALLGYSVAGWLQGLMAPWLTVLGLVSAVALFVASSLSPYNAGGTSKLAVVGLVGWLGWVAWIVGVSTSLIRL